MQTPQTNQTIKQFTPKNKNFNFCKIWDDTIQHHQQEISSRDPGRSGGEGKGKRDLTIFNTTNKGLCSMPNDELPSRKLSTERRHRRKNETVSDKRRNDRENQI